MRDIRLLVLDVDGVLTDGRLSYSDAGIESKLFHVRDGSGIKLWQASGRVVAIISGRNAESVKKRAAELGIAIVRQGVHPKNAAFAEVLREAGVTAAETCVIGDDLPDLPLMLAAGFSVAVADACDDVKAAASFVTPSPGGHGAVRQAIEHLLKSLGDWGRVTEAYRMPSIS
jgi:YrbI family 3-deoxy-D-manno-octulosonate 8-phosphate phosphatase